MEQKPSPGKLYSGDNFMADILCKLSRQGGGLIGEVTVVAGEASLKPGDDLVIHLPDGRKAFCTPSRALADGTWIVHIRRIED